MTHAWKIIGIGVVLTAALIAGELTMGSREPAVAQRSFERPAAFETNPVIGSDGSISTYGLDTGHVSDW